MKERPELMWFFVTNENEAEIICSKEWPKMRYEGGRWTGSSGWYSSQEEAIEKCGIPESPCVHCGRLFSTNYVEDVEARLLKHNRCHTCDFWITLAEEKANNRVVVGGVHYQDGGQKSGPRDFLGFGGKKWIYQREGEAVKVTNNMWFQGEIPERFRTLLPDNARFLTDQEYAELADSRPSTPDPVSSPSEADKRATAAPQQAKEGIL